MRRIVLRCLCLMVLGCGGGGGGEYDGPEPPAPEELAAITNLPLRGELFAGQKVPVLPITMVVPDSSLSGGELFQHRDILLRWTDSIIENKLANRSVEVSWVFPPALRRTALRSPGAVPDPDMMGQSVMRTPSLQDLPDPFRSNLRALVAVTGSRLALIPAAAVFRQPEPGVVKASLMMVMAESRMGTVVWRSLAEAQGGSLSAALSAALDSILPQQIFVP